MASVVSVLLDFVLWILVTVLIAVLFFWTAMYPYMNQKVSLRKAWAGAFVFGAFMSSITLWDLKIEFLDYKIFGLNWLRPVMLLPILPILIVHFRSESERMKLRDAITWALFLIGMYSLLWFTYICEMCMQGPALDRASFLMAIASPAVILGFCLYSLLVFFKRRRMSKTNE